jgi:hypothetical protein
MQSIDSKQKPDRQGGPRDLWKPGAWKEPYLTLGLRETESWKGPLSWKGP